MFENLKIKTKTLEKQWKDDLINIIRSKGHQGHGILIDSIEVKVSITSTDIVIDLKANDYIKYLDNGELLKKFKKDKMSELKEFVKKELIKDLKKSIKLKK